MSAQTDETRRSIGRAPARGPPAIGTGRRGGALDASGYASAFALSASKGYRSGWSARMLACRPLGTSRVRLPRRPQLSRKQQSREDGTSAYRREAGDVRGCRSMGRPIQVRRWRNAKTRLSHARDTRAPRPSARQEVPRPRRGHTARRIDAARPQPRAAGRTAYSRAAHSRRERTEPATPARHFLAAREKQAPPRPPRAFAPDDERASRRPRPLSQCAREAARERRRHAV
jgi:hypothetical protein